MCPATDRLGAPLTRSACETLVRELVACELADQRGEAIGDMLAQLQPDAPLNGAPVRMDSLEFMAAAQAVNAFFRLHSVGTEDYLLRHRTIGDWVEVVLETVRQGADGIAFQSGGTTGTPKTQFQPWVHLSAELDQLASLVGGARRILLLVPCRHIYGCLWGPLLASRLQVPLLAGPRADAVAHGELRAGDLVIGFPERWQYLAGSIGAFPDGVAGVTSTAPCPESLWQELADIGLSRLLEIYGSSETGGIGWRDAAEHPFQLLAHWQPAGDTALTRQDGETVALPDHVVWEGSARLRPSGRRDHAVQIAGVNVIPETVRERMNQCPDIEDCAVRTRQTGRGQRLKAFVVARHDDAQARERIADWLHTHLSAAERPVALTYGEALPRNDMGKLADWP
ncbi:AMP-binding enzyme [Aquisalimonas asiatica]|uniref:AMP-binding enzyme n=1 Tax=Aquisalimonas asiatica TaxID=406100 RepID=A0A1H8ULX5_9GAMM|nr:AMP-binding protein [Aquisalimonas asiatica]SEP04225.1 AMP-binding enzyme [Aquisalimonas asiatica]